MNSTRKTLYTLTLFLTHLWAQNNVLWATSSDPFEVLNEDEKTSVLQLLSVKDLCACAQVSKSWRRASSSDKIWEGIAEAHYKSMSYSLGNSLFIQSMTYNQIPASSLVRTVGVELELPHYPRYKTLRQLASKIIIEIKAASSIQWGHDLKVLLEVEPDMKLWSHP